MNKKTRNYLILCLSIFFTIRLFVAINYGKGKDEFGDGIGYNEYAKAITLNSNWITHPDYLGNAREPVYPLFVALIYFIFGIENYLAVYISHAVVSILTVFLLFKFTFRYFDITSTFFVLIWSGLYYFYLKYIGFFLRETLEIFLVFLQFYILYHCFYHKEFRFKFLILNGILFTILMHLNAKYLLFTPFFIYYFFQKNIRKWVLNYSLFVLLVAIFSTPWIIRNYLAYKKVVIINTKTYSFSLNDENGYLNNVDLAKKNNLLTDKGLNDKERNEILNDKNPKNRPESFIDAVKIGKKPAKSFLEKRLFMLKQYWRITSFKGFFLPYPSGEFRIWSLRHNIMNILCYGVLLIFSFFGVFRLFRIKSYKKLFLLIYPLIITTFIHSFTWSRERYRIPFAAFLIILGGEGFTYIFELAKSILFRKSI